MDTYLLLVIIHLLGTILGVGGATFIEIFLVKALKDGKVDPMEGEFLKITYTVVRIGLVLAILSGFGFLLYYQLHGQTFKLYNPVLWAKLSMVLIIAFNAILLQSHKISLYWGSALSFVTWYSAAVVGVFLTQVKLFSYLEIMVTYALCVVAGAFILSRIRKSFGVTS